jgi:hypothetical protein
MKSAIYVILMLIARGLFLLFIILAILKLCAIGLPSKWGWLEIFYPLIAWAGLVLISTFMLTKE